MVRMVRDKREGIGRAAKEAEAETEKAAETLPQPETEEPKADEAETPEA